MTTGTDTTGTTTTPPATPTLEQQVDAAVTAAQADASTAGTDLVKELTDFKTALELQGGNFMQLFEAMAKQTQGIAVLTKPPKLPDKL